jgi:hypothetical protein
MKKLLYIIIFVVASSAAIAQESFSSWTYSMGFASGDLAGYIGKASFRGATYNYTKLVNGGVGVGLEIGWNTFYEGKPYGTYTRGNWDLSGKMYRYSNNVPLLFTLSYYMKPDNTVTPYGSLGIGTMWSERRTSVGTWDIYQDAWPFVLRPEIGVVYNTGGLGFTVSSKYYYGFKTGDLPEESYFTINVGLVFTR